MTHVTPAGVVLCWKGNAFWALRVNPCCSCPASVVSLLPAVVLVCVQISELWYDPVGRCSNPFDLFSLFPLLVFSRGCVFLSPFFFFNKCVYILQSTAISCSPLLVFSRDYVFLSPVVNYYFVFTNIDTHVCSTAISCRSGAPPNRRDEQCPNSLPSQEGNRSPISALQTLFWFKKRVVFDGRIFVE